MPSGTIFCSRGTFYESQFNPLIKAGMFALFPPLISPVNPVIFTSATILKKDISAPMAYLNNEKLFYSFGQAWAHINLEGEILLGSAEFGEDGIGAAIVTAAASGLRIVETYFDIFRASVHKRPIILSSMRYAKPVKFFLTHYTRGRMNNQYNTVGFSLQGAVIDKNEGLLQSLLDTATGAAGEIGGDILSSVF